MPDVLVAGSWVCPHCGVRNVIRRHPSTLDPSIVYCDLEEGGCDKPSIVRTFAVLETRVTPIDREIA